LTRRNFIRWGAFANAALLKGYQIMPQIEGDFDGPIRPDVYARRIPEAQTQSVVITPKLLKGTPGRVETVAPLAPGNSGGWNNKANWTPIVDLRGDDNETTVFDLVLAAIAPGMFFRGGQYLPHGYNDLFHVEFGMGNGQMEFEVDAYPGCHICIPASYVRVLAFNSSGGPVQFGVFPGSMASKAGLPILTLSMGTTPGVDSTNSVAVGSIANSIPNFARRVSFNRSLLTQGYSVGFMEYNGTVLAWHTAAAGADLVNLPVPGWARLFLFSNPGPAVMYAHAMWELAL
jgi:hypothetical protein